MAHENSVRVPCLVNQATVTAETCPSHCCFNGLQSDGEMQQDAAVSNCILFNQVLISVFIYLLISGPNLLSQSSR